MCREVLKHGIEQVLVAWHRLGIEPVPGKVAWYPRSVDRSPFFSPGKKTENKLKNTHALTNGRNDAP